ncbi:MAG: ABC transporter permease subunit [Coriobacteriales bacterium]|nr:ABC transporter permease subunit [Coriobacteriales bacterium]
MSIGMNEGKARPIRLLVTLAAALVLALGVVFAAPATTAQAMTTNKATARPNEDGGDSVIGGIQTRLTWEGTVDDGEEVSSITLQLPEGSSFDGSTTRVTVLDGLNRISVDSNVTTNGDSITIDFASPLSSGSLLRLEITNMSFPSAGGDYQVTGTYTSDGGTQQLAASPSITVIANTPLQAAVNWLDEQAWVQAWNSNAFLGMFFKPQLLLTSFASLFPGWVLCLVIVIVAYPFAILLGMLFSLMKISKHKVLRAIAIVYINILRGTPLFLQIYIMFFGLPMVGINIDNNVLGVIVMAVNSSAYLAEIFRAGIESIPVGQYEAASSLGMTRMQTMTWVIIPQTVRRVIPTVTSDFITSYKDTSLLSSVGVMELMMYSKNLTTVTGNITPYVTAAIFYLIVTLPLIKVVGIVEKNLARSERGGGPRPKAKGAKSAKPAADAQKGAEPTAQMASGLESADDQGSVLMALLAPFRAGSTSMGGMSHAE